MLSRCDAMTLHRRQYDVVSTPCARWVKQATTYQNHPTKLWGTGICKHVKTWKSSTRYLFSLIDFIDLSDGCILVIVVDISEPKYL